MASENSELTEKSAPAAAAASNSTGGSNTLVTILTLVNLVVTLGILAIIFISFQREKQRPSIEDIAAKSAAEGESDKAKEGEHGAKEGKEGKEGEGKEKKKTTDFGRMVTLEQFTINLATPGSVNPKFVRVNISLEVPTEDAEAEVNSKVPQIRNTIIDLFNSKRPADLANADGRDYLKEEIRNALNSFLVTGKVKAVYFTNFALAG